MVTLDQDQTLHGKIHVKNFNAKQAHINSLICTNGTINGYHFDKIVNDTVTKQDNITVTGHKHFANLSIDSLVVKQGIDLNRILSVIQGNRIFTMSGDVAFFNSTIENIYFEDACNGMPKRKFEKMWSLQKEDTLYGDYHFNKIIVMDDLYVQSGRINNVSVKDLVEKTVKTDEPFHFDSGKFSKYLVSNGLFQHDG